MELLNDAPHPPVIPQSARNPQAEYNEQLGYFKNELLTHIESWDRMALIATTSLQDWRYLKEQGTYTEIVNMYLKTIAIR